MRLGDIVVLLADPLRFGMGRVECMLADGTLLVRFEDDRATMLWLHPSQLDRVDHWMQAV